MAKVILIHGPSAAGKSFLAKRMTEELRLPLFSKDSFKEVLFEYIDIPKTVEETQKYGMAALELSWEIIEQLARSESAFIYEANISSRSHDFFDRVQLEYKLSIFEIIVTAESSVLEKRTSKRVESGSRHAGHLDNLRNNEVYSNNIELHSATLNSQAVLRFVDTTIIDDQQYRSLISEVDQFISQ